MSDTSDKGFVTKICTVCKITKLLSKFNTRPDRPSGYRSECKKCQYKRPKKPKPAHILHAEQKLHYAIKKGKISKGLNCICCGTNKDIQSHHPDYSEPLVVIWVCPKCHRAIQKLEKRK